MDFQELTEKINRAIEARAGFLNFDHDAAWRLFNGYYEGCPGLTIDLYARTLLLSIPATVINDVQAIQVFLLNRFPQVNCVVLKERTSTDGKRRKGMITLGNEPATKIKENGIWYALDLMMNQASSLYLDTRGLRRWLLENSTGWSVFNAFAYTGSLGVAALAGGAARVVQVDRSRKFLSLAHQSCLLNNLDIEKMELPPVDFFSAVARFKLQGKPGSLFDCVIADPPFFSSTNKGTVNLVKEGVRIINKVRPLVQDGGRLIMVNNALYLSGKDYLRSLEQLCEDGYLSIEELLPIPLDSTGYPQTVVNTPPVDPSPFNHPTKIVIFKVRRKID